jgi:hypothetical protein
MTINRRNSFQLISLKKIIPPKHEASLSHLLFIVSLSNRVEITLLNKTEAGNPKISALLAEKIFSAF